MGNTAPVTDPPGTCHRVGCVGKGRHAPHTLIGVGTWEDYKEVKTCLGFPLVSVETRGLLVARCSISGSKGWQSGVATPLTPRLMAALVDEHRCECKNRSTA